MKSIIVIKLDCDKLSQKAVSIEESKVDHIKIKIKKKKGKKTKEKEEEEGCDKLK